MPPAAQTAAPPPTTSGQALQNLQGFQGSMQAPQDILSQQQQQLGIPGQQQQVSGLRQAITNSTNLLNQVAPSVYGRTQNSLVTDAQAGKQISNEQAPINTALAGQNTALSGTQADLNTALQQAQAAAGLAVTGQNDKLTALQGTYADLYKQEQDKAAQAFQQQQLAEQAREANLKSTGAGTPSFGLGNVGGSSQGTPAPAPAQGANTDPNTQNAYNNLANIAKGLGFGLAGVNEGSLNTRQLQGLASDYAATLRSANNGNVMDKNKILLYHSIFPSIGSSVPISVLANGGQLRY